MSRPARAAALGFALVLFALGIGCSSAPSTHLVMQPSVWTRLTSGDVPKTPDEAQAWLDEATRQVQGWELPVRAYCAIECPKPGGCPSECVKAEADRQKLIALRLDVQAGIDSWRRSGGSASEAATLTFLDILAKKRPEVEAILDIFRVWRGDPVPDGGPIVPGGGGK